MQKVLCVSLAFLFFQAKAGLQVGAVLQRTANITAHGIEAQPPWKWTGLKTHGFPPPVRAGHAAVVTGRGDYIFIIGGCLQGFQGIKCFNDVHTINVGSLYWKQEQIAGKRPMPRAGHTATLVNEIIYLFGGANFDATFGDAYKLDLKRKQWVPAVSAGAAVPSKRTNHAAASDSNGYIYIFGGAVNGEFTNDMWVFATPQEPLSYEDSFPINWVAIAPTGLIPSSRGSHSMTFVDGQLIVFGGYDGEALSDLHSYNIAEQRWLKLTNTDLQPAPRQAHSSAHYGSSVVVVGGCGMSGPLAMCYSDVWRFNITSMKWTQMQLEGSLWIARGGHSVSLIHSNLYAFGGCQLGLECFQDFTKLTMLDSFFRVNGKSNLTPSTSSSPPPPPLPSSSSLSSSSPPHHSNRSAVVQKGTYGPKVVLFGTRDTGRPLFVIPPTNKDFGIDHINDGGHTGMNPGECDENCDFRGVCHGGVCYCQPRFHGPACDMAIVDRENTFGIEMVPIVLGISVAVSFVIVLGLFHCIEGYKKQTEDTLCHSLPATYW